MRRDRRRRERRDASDGGTADRGIQAALGTLPEHPTAGEVKDVLAAFRAEYSAFAHSNMRRLDHTNDIYRRLVRRVVVAGVMFAVVQIAIALLGVRLQSESGATLARVQASRHQALAVTCAVESAIAQEGRSVIAGPATPPAPSEERALQALGLPPFAIRHRQQERQADAYVADIARQIDRQIGSRGDRLVQPGGTIDCRRLARMSKIGR